MATTYVRLARGERVERIVEPEPTEEWYFVRDYDAAPSVLRADDFFDGIDDAR